VEKGVREGAIHKDISPETGSMLFLGSLMPAAILGNILEDDIDILAHAEKTWPALERSIIVDTRITSKIDSGKTHEDT
jgi:hypothetical protein